mmetsp:Transcript_94073/g.196283  ORF Transcript_94073/g.196283 Transcript_94073/m.196283 type:complete len:578 (+) Transcript_94073:46-1779(+)
MAPTEEPLLAEKEKAKVDKVDDEEWATMSVRERLGWFYDRCAHANFSLPVFQIFGIYIAIGLVWFAGWVFLGMDKSQSMFCAENARRFIVYNILHGLTGIGATCGPLGVKNKVPYFAPFLHFLTPGTIASPLLPGVVGCLQKIPIKRSLLGTLTFVVYYSSLIRSLIDPSPANITVSVVCLGVATVFDSLVFFVSRGEHYGYHLICLMFPDWIAGVQCSHLMLYLCVGVSKCGPWFKYVVQVLMKDAMFTPFLPKQGLARAFYKDFPNDLSPSMLPRVMAVAGAFLEWFFPLCCLAAPGCLLNYLGVFGMNTYHFFIWSTLPMASVFEWQYYAAYINIFFYGYNSFSLPTSPGLIAFIIVTGFVLPIIGQIYPPLVPFLMSYRQYAGNWRLGVWAISKDAAEKLKKTKSYNSIVWQTEAPESWGGARAEWLYLATFLEIPLFRGVVSMMESFLKERAAKADDFYFITTFHAANAMFGWDLAVGWTTYRECIRKGLVEICDLKPGEFYWILIEPASILPPHKLKYIVCDITKGPMDSDMYIEVPYSALEGTHPNEVVLDLSNAKRGKAVNGTVFDSYY